MNAVHFLNIEYIFLRVFQFLADVPINFNLAGVPGRLVTIVSILAALGLGISLLLLALIVYVRIRTAAVEHHGFHELERQEHERLAPAVREARNPRWEAVAALAASPNESDWRRAILEADSMLAALLTERGYPGETLGEQLKSANPLQFTTLDLAWEAHRMRNALAHLGEAFPLSERDARATIDLYRRVFEEFDYI